MEGNEKFSWRARARSFRYAAKGVATLIREEHNSRIHLCAAAAAVALGLWLDLERWEWVAVVICIAAVLMAEAFNSAVEAACDRFGPECHPLIGKSKDIAAAGVLIMAAGAAVTGCIVFIPHLLALL